MTLPRPLYWNAIKKMLSRRVGNTSTILEHRGKTYFQVIEMHTIKGKSDDCWLWDMVEDNSYGYIVLDRKRYAMNRIAWMIHNKDDLLHGELVLHHCDVRPCINPQHLYKGSQADNVQDAWDRDRYDRSMYTEDHGIKTARGRGNKILSHTEVKAIKHLYDVGHIVMHLSKVFGVSRPVIYDVINERGRFKDV